MHKVDSTQEQDSIKCIVFDFGFTLCSEPYFKSLPAEDLEKAASLIFGENSTAWADPWMRGDRTSRDACEYLAQHLSYSADDLLKILHEGCSDMHFNQAVWEFAKRSKDDGRKIALVTGNMDVFSEVIVPSHGLADVFDAIVNSADHHELDKTILWQIAFDLTGGVGFKNSLSIDDSAEGVELFTALGGQAFQYTDDVGFSKWTEGVEQ